MAPKFEIPHAERVVGVPTKYQEYQEVVEQKFAKFFESGREKVEMELEKTERDIDLINFAAEAVEKYLKQYGSKKDIKIPIENIHLLKDGGVEEFTKGRIRGGAASMLYGSIVLDRSQSDIQFAVMAFHELFHAKSYKAFQMTTERKFEAYRGGFSVVSRDGRETYFNAVEEAIVGYMERRFYREIIVESELLKKEAEALKKEGKQPEFGRVREMKAAGKLLNKLFELNKDKFNNVEEISDLFIEAQATGKLLKVARLIESSLGKGSFRKLGEETARREKDS